MQVASRLTIAIHSLLVIEYFKENQKVTSDFIASSVQINPVIIRRILLQLKDANIVDIARGSGGAKLIKKATDISLFDIYQAVECNEQGGMFSFHQNPNPDCPVGSQLHTILDEELDKAQNAFENTLKATTLQTLLSKIK